MQKRYPDYRWLMWVVLGVGLALGLFYTVMMVRGGNFGAGGLATGRDLALIFLGLHLLIAVLLGFALVAALTYGIYRLRLWLSGVLRQITAYARLGHRYVEMFSHKLAGPFIAAESRAAQAQAIWRALRRG